jgi:predicted membrane protein
MENLLFMKLEITVFILSFLYITYYILTKIFNIYFNVRNKIKPKAIKKRKTALNKVNLKNKKTIKKKEIDYNISDIDSNKVTELIQKVKTNTLK